MAGKKSLVQPARGEAKAGTLGGWFERPAPPATPKATSADNLLFLGRTARVKRQGNPYQQSFKAFLQDLTFTQDEAAGGRVAQLPVHPYAHDLIDDLFEEPLLFIEKSRRVLVSWIVSAFQLWVVAGGQDPRWPALMNATGNRQVILQARKLEDIQGANYFLQERTKFIYDQFVERGFREKAWPGMPQIDFRFGQANASNGSRISCAPQGKDQARGAGATLYVAEELAFWNQGKASIESALLILLGGGHCVAISTARAGTYAADIALDRLND